MSQGFNQGFSFNPIGANIGRAIETANQRFTGVFGGEGENAFTLAGQNTIREPRNTRNAPLNDSSEVSFDAPQMPELNRENDLQQSLRATGLRGQQELDSIVSGAQQLGRVSQQNYQQKLNADALQAQRMGQISQAQAPSGSRPTSGSSTAYGTNAPPPPSTWMNAYGQQFQGSGSGRANWQNNQDTVARNNAAMSRADAAGDIARTQAQGRVTRNNANNDAALSANLAERQNALNRQNSVIDFSRQALEAARQRTSNENIAGTQAMGNLYGSMFASLQGAGSNYRYWG